MWLERTTGAARGRESGFCHHIEKREYWGYAMLCSHIGTTGSRRGWGVVLPPVRRTQVIAVPAADSTYTTIPLSTRLQNLSFWTFSGCKKTKKELTCFSLSSAQWTYVFTGLSHMHSTICFVTHFDWRHLYTSFLFDSSWLVAVGISSWTRLALELFLSLRSKADLCYSRHPHVGYV